MPTHRELAKIFAAAREVGLAEQELRDLVEAVSGQRSTRALTPAQTRTVIDSLVRAGARARTPAPKPSGRRQPPGVVKMIGAGQREYIQDLRQQLGGDWLRDEYYAGACRKVIRRAEPVTAGQAARVIEALKSRLAYNQARGGRGGTAA